LPINIIIINTCGNLGEVEHKKEYKTHIIIAIFYKNIKCIFIKLIYYFYFGKIIFMYKSSDYYLNISKSDKRKYNYNYFCKYFEDNIFLENIIF
jgi:hypothetical protein